MITGGEGKPYQGRIHGMILDGMVASVGKRF
jgi:hypothetical protein